MLFIETLCQPGTQVTAPPAVDLARQLSSAASGPGAQQLWHAAAPLLRADDAHLSQRLLLWQWPARFPGLLPAPCTGERATPRMRSGGLFT